MDNFFEEYLLKQEMILGLQNFVIALIYLLIGWIVAKIVGNLVEGGIRKSKLDERFVKVLDSDKEDDEKQVDYSSVIGKFVYYVLLLAAFVIFFGKLDLNVISQPLSDVISTIVGFVPAILEAAIILLFAWIIASVLRWLIVRGTKKTKLQALLSKVKVADTEDQVQYFMNTLGKVVFYLTLLLFIPGILDALNISGVAQPFSGVLSSILSFIPKILAAGLIFAIGWFVARIIKGIVANLLDALGTDNLIKRLRLESMFERTSFGTFVGNVVFVIILIPISISSLEMLDITGITSPAIAMLSDVMAMVPNILIAIGLIIVGVWLGKVIGGFVHGYLERLGFDKLTTKMNVGNVEVTDNKLTPSAVVGYVVQTLIVFFLAVQALYLVKFDFLVNIATGITAYLPHILAAILIIGVALIISNIVEKVLGNLLVGPATNLLAGLAKYAIIVLSGLMALSQLGIATTIVNSAFIIILGGVALAFGLAFGLGGREFAGKYLQKFDHTIDETKVKNNEANE